MVSNMITETTAAERRSGTRWGAEKEEGDRSTVTSTARYDQTGSVLAAKYLTALNMADVHSAIDLNELSLGSTMRIDFPNRDDILNFTLTIEPDEGMYKGGSFTFTFAINQNFPHDPPKVKCTQKIYHPNIDLEGNVCLNILREDWKPVLNLNAVIVGMQVRQHQI